jgi:hypothetical protein
MKEAEKLFLIEQDLKGYKSVLAKASDAIREKDISNYPIFVLHKQEVNLGVPLIEREKLNTNWSVNASSLEEFVTKQLILQNKLEEFKRTYKSPDSHICVFIISDMGAHFIFLPR